MGNVYLLNELAEKTGIPATRILEWEKDKLIKPAGITEDKTPFFTENAVRDCHVILKFSELGYTSEEILKIINKVGLPLKPEIKTDSKGKTKFLTVGELAEKINVSARTIKHWEEKGIIDSDMRSEGGFRLYSEVYIYLCSLILDLQNFGYSLDEIKIISDYFRNFLEFRNNLSLYEPQDVEARLTEMSSEIERLFAKMNKLKEGINRWEELLKKKKKEISAIKTKNRKRRL
ncbi:MAG: hypothetical protein Kow0098_22570 [Ignavibacteriaceae bacterium]